jgi:hypothetical protein
MNKTNINYLVDLGMAAAFLLSLVTGILKYRGLLHLLARFDIYLPTHIFTRLHEWGGAALGSFVLLHLVLHWHWITATTRKLVTRRRGGKHGNN